MARTDTSSEPIRGGLLKAAFADAVNGGSELVIFIRPQASDGTVQSRRRIASRS